MTSPRKSKQKGFYDRLSAAETFIESHFGRLALALKLWLSKQSQYLRTHRTFTRTGRSTVRMKPSAAPDWNRYRPDQVLRVIRTQPRLFLASYVCGLFGVLLSIHDYHHYRAHQFGVSTPFLIAAILLYIVGGQRSR